MNRNVDSRFAINPTDIDIKRSTFNRPSELLTSFNVGDIIPIYCDEVLPGDTHQIKTSKVVRLQTLITPMFGNLYLDTMFFFVPNRLVWEHWKEFMGENTSSAWIPQVQYSIPQLVAPSGGWNVGTIADYLGVPTGVDGLSVSALPFRAYALICEQWFRVQAVSPPLAIPMTDATVTGVNTGTFVTDVAKGGLPYTARRLFDYFSSNLPSPQRGPSVSLPLGEDAPVYGLDNTPMKLWVGSSPNRSFGNLYQENGGTGLYSSGSTAGNFGTNIVSKSLSTGNNKTTVYADLSAATAASISELRTAFQIQKLLEADARGGGRYIEQILVHFGVHSPDARQQRVEYLGGNRIPINVNQVVQNSSTDATSPQGNVAGYSLTTDSHGDFIKSFTEHGYIIGVCVARYKHTYQQGLERHWSRKTRYDYYYPVLAHLSEQATLNKEIYAQGPSVVDANNDPYDEQVFGYQERWAEYRFKPSKVTSEMRSAYATSLDVWHLGDDYSQLPVLSDSWIREDKANVDRVLAVQSSVSNQLLGDFYIENKTTRPMPLYSIPGLVDHF